MTKLITFNFLENKSVEYIGGNPSLSDHHWKRSSFTRNFLIEDILVNGFT